MAKTAFIFAMLVMLEASAAARIRRLERPRVPTSTIPWFPTTLPPGCRKDGQQLLPGQQKMFFHTGGCQMCSCTYDSQLFCYYGDCLIAMCTDAHQPHGACCPTCPNGRNCRVPMTGEVISAGHPVDIGGMLCECPPQNYMLPGIQSEADYTAICIPLTTTPPTTTPPTTIPVVPMGRR